MSDVYRQYRAIRNSLLQGLGPMKGHSMRHLNTLAALIWGLCPGPSVAAPSPPNSPLRLECVSVGLAFLSLLFEGGLPHPKGLLAPFTCSFNRLIV